MRILSCLPVVFLFGSTFAHAQFPLSFGVKGGVSLTDAFGSQTETSILSGTTLIPFYTPVRIGSGSKDYVVGPEVELRLPFGLAVEADALYRPLSRDLTPAQPDVLQATQAADVPGWELSVMAKYRVKAHAIRPYVDAGPAFRLVGSNGKYLSNTGVAAGAGIDARLLLLHISPEFRYTHWGEDGTAPKLTPTQQSKQNQVEFLTGFTF